LFLDRCYSCASENMKEVN